MDEYLQPFLHRTGPVLALDIGHARQAALLARPGFEPEAWPRFVLPSPAMAVAQRLRELTLLRCPVWLCGRRMGAGSQTALADCLASGCQVFATAEAAASFGPQAEALGLRLAENCPAGAVPVELGDFSRAFWETFLHAAGLPLPHLVLAAVQDRGPRAQRPDASPRMERFSALLTENPDPVRWLTRSPSADFPRLTALARATGGPVADTAAAAILGALSDQGLRGRAARQGVTLVCLGSRHITAALLYRDRVLGLYEHHTLRRTREQLLSDLHEFRLTFLPVEAVRASGGHGTAYGPLCEEAGGYEPCFVMGPRHLLLEGFGQRLAPRGDMLTAGCLGLVRACALTAGGNPAPSPAN